MSQSKAQADPLPSWNDGAAKRSIVGFVGRVTKKGGADFVQPADRIAVFDNDGTLWAEPFVPLRLPKMFNLRRDPFERADQSSNTYWDWLISHAYLIYAMQGVVAQQIEAFKKFPPRQKAASFNLDAVLQQLEESSSSKGH